MRKCSFSGCDKRHYGNGYCEGHNWQLRHLDELRPLSGRAITFEERVWLKVNKTETCWLWTGSASGGYGTMAVHGVVNRAHRVVYELLRGPIPDGMVLDHLCRVTLCVNPDHLEPVPHAVNIQRQGIRTSNSSGYRGVTKFGNRYRVRVMVNGVTHNGGLFDDVRDAGAAAAALRALDV